jgi:hypothetical protein
MDFNVPAVQTGCKLHGRWDNKAAARPGRRPPREVQETHRRSTGGTRVISLAPRWKVT